MTEAPTAATDPGPACPGPCNALWRRAVRDDTTGDAYCNTATDGHWCHACADRIVAALDRLPRLARDLFDRTAVAATDDGLRTVRVIVTASDGQVYAQLDCGHVVRGAYPLLLLACTSCAMTSTLGSGRVAAGVAQERVGKTPKRVVSPSGSPAWDVVDEIISLLGDLEVRLRQGQAHAAPAREWWRGDTAARYRSIDAAARYLRTWSTTLLAAPFTSHPSPDRNAGLQLIALLERAERAAGVDHPVWRLPAPCPTCDCLGLVREDGSEQVSCQVCGRVWTERDYRTLVRVLASANTRTRPPRRARRHLVNAVYDGTAGDASAYTAGQNAGGPALGARPGPVPIEPYVRQERTP